jgi:hypothetical protein
MQKKQRNATPQARPDERKSQRARLEEITSKQRSEVARSVHRARWAKPKKSRQPQD